MISFGPLSITLLIGALQGIVLALLLLRTTKNRAANRFLALLIVAVASMITPYIIGFAGFYDAYPWLSFAPFGTSLAFGPLLFAYTLTLTGGALPRRWPVHAVPYAVQFLSQALVFPWPVEVKNWWDSVAYADIIAPTILVASLVSIAVYGLATWRRYRAYCTFLDNTRSDGVRFDPSWIAHVLFALCAMAVVWAGFALADTLDASRNYFDRFWFYVGLSLLAIYLGVEGWRNAALDYPPLAERGQPETNPQPESEAANAWAILGDKLAATVDQEDLWRDPDITVATLARAMATNTTYVSRALNEGLGVSFSAFINQRRVVALQALLRDPKEGRDLLTLALEVGFNSKASFNRAFAEFAGMSPSAFRRASHSKATAFGQ
jgi:AraC-like DNA-binding protein